MQSNVANANSNKMNPHSPDFAESQEGEMNVVSQWTRTDPIRWISGILAGLFAGAVAIVVAGLFARAGGMEFLFPVKLLATVVLGASATEFGMNLGSIITGLIVMEGIFAFWGFVFSHFVFTNCLKSLLAMGLVWSIFLWVFNWNLYLQSFPTIPVANVPRYLAYFVCLAYGLSLSSVKLFDAAFRGNSH